MNRKGNKMNWIKEILNWISGSPRPQTKTDTSAMTWQEAEKLLEAGHRVTNILWPAGEYLEKDGKKLYRVMPTGRFVYYLDNWVRYMSGNTWMQKGE